MKKKHFILYMALICLIALCCNFCGSALFAAEYHVSKKGNDTKGDGSLSDSWKTIGYALSQIKGGDIISIHEGVYNEYDLRVPVSGTKGAPTTIRASKGEHVIIDGKQDLFSKNYIFYLVSDKRKKPLKYVTISGLEITGGWGGGNIQVGGDSNHCCTHITIKDCEIWNGGGKEFASRNPSLVRFSSTKYCKIINCRLHGDDEGTCYRTGIKIWRETSYLTVEHNEIYGIILKGVDNKHGGSDRYLTIRYNYIHDLDHIGINLNGDHSIVGHNLVVNCTIGIRIYDESGGPGGSFSLINHNTIIDCGTGIVLGQTKSQQLTNCTVMNNLVVNSSYRGIMPELVITAYRSEPYNHNHTIDFNCYYNSKYKKVIRYYGKLLFSLYEWQKFSGLDIHSLDVNPDFKKVSRHHYSPICNYRVGQTSKAFRSASDKTDMGSDIYLLAKGMCPPRAPTNLTLGNPSKVKNLTTTTIP